jgi:hypothetical protein
MTKHLGYVVAWNISTAHGGLQLAKGEGKSVSGWFSSPDATETSMDRYNNIIGRKIASENLDASDEQLAELIKQAITGGQMLVIVQSDSGTTYLQWSDGTEVKGYDTDGYPLH